MTEEGFGVDPWAGMLFFRLCQRYKINNLEDRRRLLRELVRRKKAKYVRDIRPLMAGKKVMKVGFKPQHDVGEHYCPECKPKETL